MDALSAAFLNAAGANAFDFCDTHVPNRHSSHRACRPGAVRARRAAAADRRRAVAGVHSSHQARMQDRTGDLPRPLRQGLAYRGDVRGLRCCRRLRQVTYNSTTPTWSGHLETRRRRSSPACANAWAGRPRASVSGNAARNGMWSALLADELEPPEPIAGVQGFLNAMAEPPNWAALTDGLGDTWELAQNAIDPLSLRLRDSSVPRLRAGLAARTRATRSSVAVLRGNPLLSDRTDRPDILHRRRVQVERADVVAAALVLGQAGLDHPPTAAPATPRWSRCGVGSRSSATARSRPLPRRSNCARRTAARIACRRLPRAGARPIP